MITLNKKITVYALAFCMVTSSAIAHDVLIEVKGAAFIPTASTFKDIYGSCGEFGLEITAGSLFDHLYAFSSIDFLIKNGETVSLSSATKIHMIDLAFGFKYFFPFSCGDVYLGVGVQPTYTSIDNESSDIVEPAQWNCGGIAKVGVIFDMPHSFFADIFVDYSFIKLSSSDSSTPINGPVIGIGFGYRFN